MYDALKNRVLLMEIWDDVKQYIKNDLKMGEIIEVLKKEKIKFYTCVDGYPIEYCAKENIEETFEIKTDMGYIFNIKQSYLGLNYEMPCDSSEYCIYNSNNELLFKSSEKEGLKMTREI